MSEDVKQIIFRIEDKDETIKGSIKSKEEENKRRDESFDMTWKNYNKTLFNRKEVLNKIYKARISIAFKYFLVSLMNSDVKEEKTKILDRLLSYIKELKDERTILSAINIALEKLQAHKVDDCNCNINELLDYIYEKYDLIFDMANIDVALFLSRISGIDSQGSDGLSIKKEEVESKIKEKLIVLGLDK